MTKYLNNKELEPLNWVGEKFNYDGMYRKKTPGDGSCYFHAILDAYFVPYRTGRLNGKLLDRFSFVKKFRKDLASLLSQPRINGKTYYETLSQGELPSLSKAMPEVSINSMKNGLVSFNSVNYMYHELVSDVLNKDVYILDSKSKDVYIIDSDLDLYYKKRNSVVILFIPGHFEVVGITVDGTLETYFHHKNPFIQAIRRRIDLKLDESIKK